MVEVEVKKNVGKKEHMKANFPSSWNELSPKQLLYIADNWEIYQLLVKEGDNLRRVRSLLIFELCDLRWRGRRKLAEMLRLVDEKTPANILDVTNFVFTLKLTRNILPEFTVGPFWTREKYAGPGDKLGDIDVEEFSYAFACYVNYEMTRHVSHLNKLVAVLYRPCSKDFLQTGERKLPFNNKLVEVHEAKLKKLSYTKRYAVYLFFKGCIEFFSQSKKYGAVFRRAEKMQGENGGSFLDSVIMMSGGKFGPFDTTKKTNLLIFLKDLNDAIIKSRNRNKK
jgi:hypothetical protein